MITFNRDIIFLYKFDSREPLLKYGKIRLSALPDKHNTLIDEIKPIILDVINNSGKTWRIDYWDISLTIISIINRDELGIDILDDDDTNEQYIYQIFIDVRNYDNLKYYYDGNNVIV